MNITRIFWAAVVAVLFLVSCEKDKQINEVENRADADKKTIIVGGEPLYAGYGYDPGEDRAFRNAIYPDAIHKTTDIQPALSVDIRVLKDEKSVNEFARYSYKVSSSSSFFGVFKSSRSTTHEIQARTKLNERHVTVIARINAKHQRFFTDANPKLHPAAQNLIKRDRYDEFLENYSTMYVSDRTTGGEVYYIYTFSYGECEAWSKFTFEQKASASIAFLFNADGATGATDEERHYLEQRLESVNIISSVPGFAPAIVRSVSDFNREVGKLQNYLRNHPEKATTVAMTLKPYKDLVNNEKFGQRYEQKKNSLAKLDKWQDVKQNLRLLYPQAVVPSHRTEIGQLIGICNANIARAERGEGVGEPDGRFQNLIHKVKNARVPLHVYTHPSRGRYENFGSLNTRIETDYNVRKDGDGTFVYRGLIGYLLKEQAPGTKPLFATDLNLLWRDPEDVVLYRTAAYDTGNVKPVVLGYYYANPVPGSVPLVEYHHSMSSYLEWYEFILYSDATCKVPPIYLGTSTGITIGHILQP